MPETLPGLVLAIMVIVTLVLLPRLNDERRPTTDEQRRPTEELHIRPRKR